MYTSGLRGAKVPAIIGAVVFAFTGMVNGALVNTITAALTVAMTGTVVQLICVHNNCSTSFLYICINKGLQSALF